MKASVVISTYSVERFNDVLECITSLSKQTLLPYEIILALDPDEKLRDFYASRIPSHVKIVISEEKGLSNARNAGVRRALGDVVAFIDDDAFADKEWLRNLVKNYDDSNVLGVGGFIKPIWESRRLGWFPEELDWVVGCSYKGLPEHKSYVRNPIGCNMSFRKEVFERVGYFKSNIGRVGKKLVGSEEAEFSIRLLRKFPKSKIIYDPSSIVYHKVPNSRASFRYLMKRSFYEGFSKALITNYKPNPLNSLSTEEDYLKYLLKNAVPLRLKRFYIFDNICQLMTILISTCSVLAGYIIGFARARDITS